MSTSSPSVCIVLLNYNQKKETLACLKSLISIDYQNYQIIIVDNGSIDQSVEEIRASFPYVRILELQFNHGCSGGRNRGLQQARLDNPDYVLFLDNDTTVCSDFLSKLVDVMEAEPTIGIASSVILHDDDNSVCWMAGGLINGDGTLTALHFNQSISGIPKLTYAVDWVPGCVLLTRRDAYITLCTFDDSLFFYFEDADWCARAMMSGYRIVVVPQSIVNHKISQSLGGKHSSSRLYYWVRNRLIFAGRYSKAGQKARNGVAIIFEELVNAIGDLRINKPGRAKARFIGIFHFLIGRTGRYEVSEKCLFQR